MSQGSEKESRQVRRRLEQHAEKLGITVDELRAQRKEQDQSSAGISRRKLLDFGALGAGVLTVGGGGAYLAGAFNGGSVVEYRPTSNDPEQAGYDFLDYMENASRDEFVVVQYHNEACESCHEQYAQLAGGVDKAGDDVSALKVVVVDAQNRDTVMKITQEAVFPSARQFPMLQVWKGGLALAEFDGQVLSEDRIAQLVDLAREEWSQTLDHSSLKNDEQRFG
ncbi:MAG: hypothetical protein AB8B83_09400 [Bdellovibrionales bacterium]